ncbi:MAG TPA: methyltransferase domain-containing protein [Methanomicrobia archaeon]|nr:methyltransferase domain-containing protein [Methanomicrobia archaeon]
MQLAFELSGEHETLPRAELLASLDALNIRYTIKFVAGRIFVIDAQLAPESARLFELARRLGMTHQVYEVLDQCGLHDRELLIRVESMDLESVMGRGRTFAVCVHFMELNRLYPRRQALLKAVGECITRKGYTVDLNRPAKTFVLLFTADTCSLCTRVWRIDKRQFGDKRPHARPFFLPGVIMPKVARALVNLSGIRANERLLDPFCGTGGIVLEGAMVGARVMAADIQRKMVYGAQKNMAFFSVPCELLMSDSKWLPLRSGSMDAVVTDLPYGRASVVAGAGIPEDEDARADYLARLYAAAMVEIHRVLKPGKRAVMVSNIPSLPALTRGMGFLLCDEHAYRVHKSLTRYITVLEKA